MEATVWPVPLLTRWGLSPDADLVFRTLTMFGPQTASTLERDLGIPRRRVERALSDLDDAGAAQPTVSSGQIERRWRARSSEDTVRGLRKWRHRRRPAPRTLLNEPYRSLRGLELGEGLRHLQSREATRLRLAELVAVARQSAFSMHPELTAVCVSAAPNDRLACARVSTDGKTGAVILTPIPVGDPAVAAPSGPMYFCEPTGHNWISPTCVTCV